MSSFYEESIDFKTNTNNNNSNTNNNSNHQLFRPEPLRLNSFPCTSSANLNMSLYNDSINTNSSNSSNSNADVTSQNFQNSSIYPTFVLSIFNDPKLINYK